MKLGKHSVTEFALAFRTLTTGSGLNEPALKLAYHHGLNQHILTKLGCRDDQVSLNSLFVWTICYGTKGSKRQSGIQPLRAYATGTGQVNHCGMSKAHEGEILLLLWQSQAPSGSVPHTSAILGSTGPLEQASSSTHSL